MTVAQFEAVRLLLNLSDDRVNAARAVLVDGQTLQSVGAQHGWTRQAVDDAVGIAWKTLARYQAAQRAEAGASAVLPRGWEQVTFTAPRTVIDQLRVQVAEALAAVDEASTTKAAAPRKRPAARKHSVPTPGSSGSNHEPAQGERAKPGAIDAP